VNFLFFPYTGEVVHARLDAHEVMQR
jgi:hypothetical protein